jgi:hypothetical protein
MAKGDFRGWLHRVKVRVFQAVGFAFLVLMLGCAKAGDWSTEDTYRQAAVTALLVADWGQTRWIAKHNGLTEPGRFPVDAGERNPILGKYPSGGKVDAYFAAAIVGHAAISYVLPPDWRKGWQYVWIGLELGTVNANRAVGIKMAW